MRYVYKPKVSKYRAQKTRVGDVLCASKLEAAYYRKMEMLQHTGEVRFFLFQVPFRLDGGLRYVVDFVVFYTNGVVEFVDVKGRDTPMSKLKRRQVEARYPIEIKLVS